VKYIDFFRNDLWRIRPRDLPRRKAFFVRSAQVTALACRDFVRNNCKFKASALTFYSLLSIVPILAVMFGIAKGFGLEQRVQEEIASRMQGQAEQKMVAEKIMTFADSMLARTNGGVIAGIGVAFLFWTIIGVLSNIENSLNEIWHVTKPRTLGRKFSDYLSTMLICPILIVISGSLTIFVSSQIKTLVHALPLLSQLGPVFWLILKLTPYITLWVAFTFLFAFMPNTRVKYTSALIGGIVAGTAFQITQWIYINGQIGVSKYGAIYGSFAALPLFLMWFQLSWLILLFGAEVSFAHQNVEAYEFEDDCATASNSFKTLLSLLLTRHIVAKFCRGEMPADAVQLSHELDIPLRLVNQVLADLADARIVARTDKSSNGEPAWQPAVDVDRLTVKFVLDRLDHRGSENIPITRSNQFERLTDSLRNLDSLVESSSYNIRLKDLS
jgi:membrane protein